jgi:hypothetical protein
LPESTLDGRVARLGTAGDQRKQRASGTTGVAARAVEERMPKKVKNDSNAPPEPPVVASPPSRVSAEDLDAIVHKLKLLEFGLYGLQESGRISPLDIEDLGPFVRLAEEIGSDVAALQGRLEAPRQTPHQD